MTNTDTLPRIIADLPCTELIEVEGGTFEMGSNDYDDEKPIHKVTLDTFYMAQYPCTQALWQKVMGSNPSYYKGDRLPVEQVSWDDIVNEFLPRLNKRPDLLKPAGCEDWHYRLPTEAEWEYAARGGPKSGGYAYSGGNMIDEVAWYTENTNDASTRPVGLKLPNELKLYDMSGNVWEWCHDWYGSYPSGHETNPQGAKKGVTRVLRGGSYFYGSDYCRPSFRSNRTPGNRFSYDGFRLVLSPLQFSGG